MFRSLHILAMPVPLIIALISSALPGNASAQDQNAGTNGASQRCAELRQRGPDFEQLANACQHAVTAPHTLPDFVCAETVKQYLAPKAKPQVITAELTIEQ